MEYRGKFGDEICEVHVEARASQHGGPVYVAQAFVYANHTLYVFENDKRQWLEIFGVDERDTLSRAEQFLIDHAGPKNEPLAPAPELKSAIPIMPMSKRKVRER